MSTTKIHRPSDANRMHVGAPVSPRSMLRVHPSLSAEGPQGTTRLSSLLAAGRVLREDLARRNERGFWLMPRGAPSKWS